MRIGGLQKFSLVDYPGLISAIVFTSGCNFRCPYCHNPELVNSISKSLTEEYIFSFLDTRRGKIDAVVISGGEPTLHNGLFDFITVIKKMGFLVKLDTNGTNSKLLSMLLENNLIDYVAMDIKSDLENYSKVTKTNVDLDEIQKSIKIIMNSNIKYEFRTTIVKGLISKENILNIGKELKGADKYIMQKFVSTKVLDQNFINSSSVTDEEFNIIKANLEKYISEVSVR